MYRDLGPTVEALATACYNAMATSPVIPSALQALVRLCKHELAVDCFLGGRVYPAGREDSDVGNLWSV